MDGKTNEELEYYKEQIISALNDVESEKTIKIIFGFVLGSIKKEKQTS